MIAKNTGILSALAISASVLLTGCGGDYPDEGKMDLSEIQKNAKIIGVEGNIYGLKTGVIERFAAYEADFNAIDDYNDTVVEALRTNQPVPELKLTYPELSENALPDYAEGVITGAQAFIDSGNERSFYYDGGNSLLSDYRSALEAQLMSYLEKSVPLTIDGEDVVFEGVGDGYEALLAFAEIVAEVGSQGRDSVSTLEFVDLTPEAMKDASEIVIPFTRKGVDAGYRLSPDDPTSNRFINNVMDRIEGIADAR